MSEAHPTDGVGQLAQRVQALLLVLERSSLDHDQDVGARLKNSVLRPLSTIGEFAGLPPVGDADEGAGQPPEDPTAGIWELARSATALYAASSSSAALGEAVAALQGLAIARADDEPQAAGRLADLKTLQAGLSPRIQCAPNGPYVVTNVARVVDWLGQALPERPTLALCRCGASATKPLCDGSHAETDFVDAKDPNRVPDRLDRYVGQQVTILDNRGTCQHSGFCTDRLATVFRVSQEPFVAPSGGRMDEIIRAVRDCPSGALSYAIDGVEARAEVDWNGTRQPQIEVSKDGPFRITGDIELDEPDGTATPRNAGASHEHFALCRCGHSQNKPFCSGMHWYVGFQDPVPDPEQTPTMFEWAGGLPALTRMTRLFYEKHVPQDPLLAPLFANMSADHPERVAKWLGEVFGGANNYSHEYGGYPRMLSQHVGKGLTEQQRVRWVELLMRSAHEAGLANDPEFRSAFQAYIEWGSRLAVENSQTDARPPEHMPMPHWDWNTAAGPPGSRISALAGPEPEPDTPPVLPGPDEPLSFAQHIKPLFRQRDRQSMQFVFDLWSQDDVSQHAAAILERLRNGTMPCDGAWPPEQTDVFARWVDSGAAE
ncbi:MAG: CDGSH iron-sulfur domain-containing protein [Solirubrobacteraceae bacterium]